MTIQRILLTLTTLVGVSSVYAFPIISYNTNELNECDALRNVSTVYDGFRSKYPFHFQTVGVAEYPDNSCLFLVSEPSPEVSENAIRQVFLAYDYFLQVKKHKLGYDGYIKDVVIVVNAVTHDQISQLENNLHRLLFSTDYKAERSTLQLPVNDGRRFFSSGNLNYQISLAELHNWFITSKELFLTPNNQKVSIQTMLVNSRPGVYLSDKPGFVAWVINKKEDLTRQKSAIREFSLDSDILLGAFANANRLIIIGRERVASLSELPPLSIETVLMLASCPQPQLSQSLDINDILAGKIISRGVDWCPTYLSDELENTEYGDLLTITDLLLKGWSESGQMKNLDFNYPVPRNYPFIKPLSSILAEKEEQKVLASGTNTVSINGYSLVYNWNTNDAVYSMKMPDYAIYAIASTGALPVSYFNDQHSAVSIGKEYELKAYEYFSNTKNTDLARVVQYQTLYSLFFDNQLFSTTKLPPCSQSAKQYLLESYATTVLRGFKDLTPASKTNLVHRIAQEMVSKNYDSLLKAEISKARKEQEEEINKEIRRQGLSVSDPQVKKAKDDALKEFEKNADEWIAQNKNTLISQYESLISQKIEEIQQILRSMSDKRFAHTCRALSYPRGNIGIEVVNENEIILLQNGINALALAGVYKSEVYKTFGIDLGQVMDYFVQSLSSNGSEWIKTPSITRTFEGYNAVGGHNLSASLKMVKSLTEYVPRFDFPDLQNDIRTRENVIPAIVREHRGL